MSVSLSSTLVLGVALVVASQMLSETRAAQIGSINNTRESEICELDSIRWRILEILKFLNSEAHSL